MRAQRLASLLLVVVLAAACGGNGSSSSGGTPVTDGYLRSHRITLDLTTPTTAAAFGLAEPGPYDSRHVDLSTGSLRPIAVDLTLPGEVDLALAAGEVHLTFSSDLNQLEFRGVYATPEKAKAALDAQAAELGFGSTSVDSDLDSLTTGVYAHTTYHGAQLGYLEVAVTVYTYSTDHLVNLDYDVDWGPFVDEQRATPASTPSP